MRKGILVVFLLVAIVAIVTVPAGAKAEKVTTSQGQPFQEIWTAIKDLQTKLNAIQLTPGPQGPKGDPGTCTCAVSEEEFNALKARVAALEGGCHPAPEACNNKDDDCDGVIDNGNLCGTGQACIQGQCISECQPVPEVCNGKDDNCDGVVDEGTTICDQYGAGLVCIQGQCIGTTPSCYLDADCPPGMICGDGMCR